MSQKYKMVTLPEPARAQDNSGKAPTITTSVGKTQHQFSIQSQAYEIVYTARDEAGLTAHCTWYLTIKGLSVFICAYCRRIDHKIQLNN